MEITLINPSHEHRSFRLTLGVPFLLSLTPALTLSPISDFDSLFRTTTRERTALGIISTFATLPRFFTDCAEITPSQLLVHWWAGDEKMSFYDEVGNVWMTKVSLDAEKKACWRYYRNDGTFVVGGWQMVVPVGRWLKARAGDGLPPEYREQDVSTSVGK